MKVLVILVSIIMVVISSSIIIKSAFESDSKSETIHILYAGFIGFPIDDVAFICRLGLLGLATGLFKINAEFIQNFKTLHY